MGLVLKATPRTIEFQGLKIALEHRPGSKRSGTDPDGRAWSTVMRAPYGYIVGATGRDNEGLDCFMGEQPASDWVYIVHQHKIERVKAWPGGTCQQCGQGPEMCSHDIDEEKVVLGAGSIEEARRIYLSHYDDERFLGPITAMPIWEFKVRCWLSGRQRETFKGPTLVLKSHVRQHTRRTSSGGLTTVHDYDDKRTKHEEPPHAAIAAPAEPPPPEPEPPVEPPTAAPAAPTEPAAPGKPSQSGKVWDALLGAEEAARARLNQKLGGMFSGVDPTMLADLAIVGAVKMIRGTFLMYDWSRAMVAEFGEGIKPHLPAIHTRAKKVMAQHLETAGGRMANTTRLLEIVQKGMPAAEWYEKSSVELKELFGDDSDMMINFLAACSTGSDVKSNVTLALKAYRQWKSGEEFTGYLPAVIAQLKAAVAGKPFGGPKIENFTAALKGDLEGVAVDRWVLRAFGMDIDGAKRPSKSQFAFIKRWVIEEARAVNMTPRQFQAAIWSGIKFEATGDGSNEAYETHIKRKMANDPELTQFIANARKFASEGGGAAMGKMLVLKAHVRQHPRRTQSGGLTTVHDHERKSGERKTPQPVLRSGARGFRNDWRGAGTGATADQVPASDRPMGVAGAADPAAAPAPFVAPTTAPGAPNGAAADHPEWGSQNWSTDAATTPGADLGAGGGMPAPGEAATNSVDNPARESPVPPAAGPYQPAATVAEAERWARNNYPHMEWDWTGAHVEVVNEVMGEFHRLAQKYPQVAASMKGMGTFMRGRMEPGELAPLFQGRYASSVPGGWLVCNPEWYGDPKKFKRSKASDARVGWHPPGTGTIAAHITHEFGHMMQWYLEAQGDSYFLPYVGSDGHGHIPSTLENFRKSNAPSGKVSRYAVASTDERRKADECWAEGFAWMEHGPQQGKPQYVKNQEALIGSMLGGSQWTGWKDVRSSFDVHPTEHGAMSSTLADSRAAMGMGA